MGRVISRRILRARARRRLNPLFVGWLMGDGPVEILTMPAVSRQCHEQDVGPFERVRHFESSGAVAVEIPDPGHPARVSTRHHKKTFAARLAEAAREAGAHEPERLGEQRTLLLDGASARSRVLDADSFAPVTVDRV